LCWGPPLVPPPSLPLFPLPPAAWSSIFGGGEEGGPAPLCWAPPPVPPPPLPLFPLLSAVWSSILFRGGEEEASAPLRRGPPPVFPLRLPLLPLLLSVSCAIPQAHLACHCRLWFFTNPARSMFARTPPPWCVAFVVSFVVRNQVSRQTPGQLYSLSCAMISQVDTHYYYYY
jgi:hypothetical protein